jgi:hypothetical protein
VRSRQQRELRTRLEGPQLLGVPGLRSAPAVRAAIERVWFEQMYLRINYVDAEHLETTRDLGLHGVLMQ